MTQTTSLYLWSYFLFFQIGNGEVNVLRSAGFPKVQQATIDLRETFTWRPTGLRPKMPLYDISFLRFSHDGSKLAGVAPPLVVIWDCHNGKELHKLDFSRDGVVLSVEVSKDGRHLYVSLGVGVIGGRISKWDLKTQKRLYSVPGYGGSMRLLPGDKELSCLFDGIVTVRDTDKGTILRKLKTQGPIRYRTHDPRLVFEVQGDKRLRLWNVETSKETAVYELPKGATKVTRSGKMFYRFDQKANSLTFWSFPKGEKISSIQCADKPIRTAFDPKDRVIAVGFAPNDYKKPGGRVSLYDIATGKELTTLERPPGRPFALTFSPDGTLLAGSSDQVLQVWRVTWPKEKAKK